MVVLRPWTNYRALVVIVILITDIPIEPVMQLNREPRFRRLITHWIRCDQRARVAGRIRHAITLPIILIDSVSRKQRGARSDLSRRLNKEEIVPHEVETIAKWVLNTIEEIIDYRLAVYPVVVVAGTQRESRRRGPIK